MRRSRQKQNEQKVARRWIWSRVESGEEQDICRIEDASEMIAMDGRGSRGEIVR